MRKASQSEGADRPDRQCQSRCVDRRANAAVTSGQSVGDEKRPAIRSSSWAAWVDRHARFVLCYRITSKPGGLRQFVRPHGCEPSWRHREYGMYEPGLLVPQDVMLLCLHGSHGVMEPAISERSSAAMEAFESGTCSRGRPCANPGQRKTPLAWDLPDQGERRESPQTASGRPPRGRGASHQRQRADAREGVLGPSRGLCR
jgi:hypothetical protein